MKLARGRTKETGVGTIKGHWGQGSRSFMTLFQKHSLKGHKDCYVERLILVCHSQYPQTSLKNSMILPY